MSAGAFTRGKYQDNDLNIRPIRVQPETIAMEINNVANVQPSGAIDTSGAAQTNRSKRAYGVHARTVTIVFPTTAPGGYLVNSPIRLPILTAAVWDGIITGQAVEYLGGDAIVISKSPELIR